MTKPADAPQVTDKVTATEIADMLGVSRQSANRMIHEGVFDSLEKLGKRPIYQVLTAEVEKLAKKRSEPKAEKEPA